MSAERFFSHFSKAHTFNLCGRAGEIFFHKLGRQTNRIKNLRTTIRLISADAHFGHDFENAFINRLDITLHGFISAHLLIKLWQQCFQSFKSQIRVYGLSTIACQHAELMHFARFTRFNYKPHRRSKTFTDQMMMRGRCGEQSRNRRTLG